MITLIIGKKDKTKTALEAFLDNDNTFFISNGNTLYNTEVIIKKYLDRDFPEDKKSKYIYQPNIDLTKVSNLAIDKRMRNSNLVIDANVFETSSLKDLKHFSYMNNINVILTVNSIYEESIRVVKL
jgi:hypothetical protein